MKSIRLPILSTLLFFTVTLLFAATPNARASAEDKIDQALTTSKLWVNQIDAGKYEDSYSATCGATHDKFPEDRWVTILKSLRKPWGAVVSRKQLSHVYKANGLRGLEGECMVITYDSTFRHQNDVTETVQLKWEDGKWRPAGYLAGTKESPDSVAMTPLPSTTETHTVPHVKPQPR